MPDPLSFTVHGVSAPVLDDPGASQQRTRIGRVKMLVVLALCAAPVVASYITFFARPPAARSNYGTLIAPTRGLPALTLTALDGSPVAAATLRGQWLLVAVDDAACNAACERRLYVQRQLREMLGRDRDRLDRVWFVTGSAGVRPALRDAMRTAPAATVLRADRAELARWLEPAAGNALEDHLYLVDPMGEWMMRLPAIPDPSRVKRDLERLLRAAESWDRPGR
jgi:hypothetical protein